MVKVAGSPFLQPVFTTCLNGFCLKFSLNKRLYLEIKQMYEDCFDSGLSLIRFSSGPSRRKATGLSALFQD